jgi:hypothetical protein
MQHVSARVTPPVCAPGDFVNHGRCSNNAQVSYLIRLGTNFITTQTVRKEFCHQDRTKTLLVISLSKGTENTTRSFNVVILSDLLNT